MTERAVDLERRLLLGAHMSVRGGPAAAVARGVSVGCRCMQIFCQNPRQWRPAALSDDAVAAFRKALRGAGIRPVVSHANYLINLAAASRGDWRRSIRSLKEELSRCRRLGLLGVVVHPGSHQGRGVEEGVKRVAEALNAALDEPNKRRPLVLLENTAGQGFCLGGRFEHLAAIMERVERRARVGVCFDTCHAFAAGYDLRTEEAYARVWEDFDAVIGRKRLRVLHLNDSKTALGSGADRHEHIGKGRLGSRAFRLLMQDDRLAAIPKILETPKGAKDDGAWDRRNLRLLRRLAGRNS